MYFLNTHPGKQGRKALIADLTDLQIIYQCARHCMSPTATAVKLGISAPTLKNWFERDPRVVEFWNNGLTDTEEFINSKLFEIAATDGHRNQFNSAALIAMRKLGWEKKSTVSVEHSNRASSDVETEEIEVTVREISNDSSEE